MDLNIDLGELDAEPAALFDIATTANVACGGHAGGGALLRRALERARDAGVSVAAHPSYPDRAGFGRSSRFSDPSATKRSVEEQCLLLRDEAELLGIEVGSVKPHGALYHDAASDPAYATALLDAAITALPSLRNLVGPPGSVLERLAHARGLGYLREGFADRRYDEAGQLVPRSSPGALITDPLACAEQAVALGEGGRFDTLCLHGDTPGAVEIGRAVREALERAGLLPGAVRR
ncbi:MAG: LamB/YcsF family protein [Myxococcales bacterium]|nr:LamB/YcsF family protein [Myxococcales bacterium]